MTARTALVTGVVGGIGAAIASRLAADGARVVLTDLAGDALENAAAERGLPALGCDLCDPVAVHDLHARITADYGAPLMLVNAAGGVCNQVGTALEDVDPAAWHRIFAVNVDATLYLSQSLVPAMKTAGWGRIVTISSGAGLRPSLTGIHAYTAAKHALVGLTKQLSLELGQHGITVNSIAPGFVLSNPATRRQWDAYGPEGQTQLVQRIHTRRLGTPEDIAAAAAFLTSAQASWITGQILSVDGGIS
ncbi:SDR family NAD(P)-dependent oxidoreductase [Sulfitobacter guttiformis]|uniref:3-oxoacyl-[acyl-carrier protein] reductase n=1 Tax=Sulfitobacter guttiformis TaxID=74349 RepID=A0A420DT52_9RHOB|nr:SDR family NAD(P)-dependent oxidoreductase [Sulfitobacter guttiformis]KIN71027.1 KR domain superfamily [Sulfitobacter guttiformis KCTC 32187]RKE97511.1 3-oxoacyl-[acyl-carrier protein] reductase [Sulfitobacter guttiformis]